ncbi:MAG: HU family DNA-binding protein [Deltaproteobacteria bacterium]|jgi:DNA-binding protein HU-beta|nr:HU family DNA-binding protein [Deltaproteobacteria bacterium]
MTKAELVAKIAENANLTQSQASKALNCLIELATDEIAETGALTLAGLGSFAVVERAARSGFNPRTKEAIHIPATKSVKFKCSKPLKDRVNS